MLIRRIVGHLLKKYCGPWLLVPISVENVDIQSKADGGGYMFSLSNIQLAPGPVALLLGVTTDVQVSIRSIHVELPPVRDLSSSPTRVRLVGVDVRVQTPIEWGMRSYVPSAEVPLAPSEACTPMAEGQDIIARHVEEVNGIMG